MDDNSMRELERLRKQISQQEKMASLGLLSAGIAHEIQNPLNFVINFSKLSCKLLQDMEDVLDELENKLPADADEEIREIMDDLKSNMCKIEENGNRASNIVRGILLYSRGKDDEYIPTDLCQLTKEYVWLSYHAVRANNKSFNVAIIEEYDNTLPQVKVIPQDFSRAVLNLMNNACYAVFSKSKGVTESPYNPTATGYGWLSKTMAWESRRRSKRNSIHRSSPPNRSGKGPVSASLSPSQSSNKNITERSRWNPNRTSSPVSPSPFRFNN